LLEVDNKDNHNKYLYPLMLKEMQVMMQMDNFHNNEGNLYK